MLALAPQVEPASFIIHQQVVSVLQLAYSLCQVLSVGQFQGDLMGQKTKKQLRKWGCGTLHTWGEETDKGIGIMICMWVGVCDTVKCRELSDNRIKVFWCVEASDFVHS